MIMKKNKISIALLCIIAFISSCEKDKGLIPNISFKTGVTYISKDTSLPAGTNFTIGINASKSEDVDVLKQFNISKSVNGAAATSEFTKALEGSEGDNYSYDFTSTLTSNQGQANKYTFTVTNRDGLTNQVSVTINTQ